MKRIVVLFVVILIAAAGCSRQSQEPKGQAPSPNMPVMMKSPEEMRQLEQLAQQAPKNPRAWTILGDALMDSKRFSEAIDAYKKSLAIDPNNVDVRVDLGTCFKNLGKPEQAIEEYRKAAKINPNHAFAHRNLGVVFAYDLHKNKEAAQEFEKYLALAPNAPDAAEIRNNVQLLKATR
jgi:tetratricopeptide (TPR) repeat protein